MAEVSDLNILVPGQFLRYPDSTMVCTYPKRHAQPKTAEDTKMSGYRALTIDGPPLQKFFDGGAAEASGLGFL
jgi:hypothetical protein